MSDLKFHVFDYYTSNIDPKIIFNDTDSDDDFYEDEQPKFKSFENTTEYTITMFGKTIKGEIVACIVEGFPPYFYIKVPNSWNKEVLTRFINWIKSEKRFKVYKNCLRVDLCKFVTDVKIFRGFSLDKYKFVRLVFTNTLAMRKCTQFFTTEVEDKETGEKSRIPAPSRILGITNGNYLFQIFESKIDPLLRFIHHSKTKPCGNVFIKKGEYEIIDEKAKITNCDMEFKVNWTKVHEDSEQCQPPLKIMGFDIECNSSHGDFPVPNKDCTKLSRDIIDAFEKIYKSLNKLRGRNNVKYNALKEEYGDHHVLCKEMIRLALSNENQKDKSEYEINNIYLKSRKFKIDGNKCKEEAFIDYIADQIKENTRVGNYLAMNYKESSKTKQEYITRINRKLNKLLPSVQGDEVIQIGSCFINYGDQHCYRKHIITLDTCNDVEDTDTIVKDNEKDVIDAWIDLIREEDPDIITGYNIFGFDIPYLYRRAEELGIRDFKFLGRTKNVECDLIQKQGKIKTEYMDMPGRIQVDILKVVQRDYNLDSYRLDAVSSNFIRGNITNFEKKGSQTIINSDNIKGLNIGNYINFIIEKGYDEDRYNNGQKFMIKGLDGKQIIIDEDIDIKFHDDIRVKWCLGKDDVSPNDIFNYQKKGPEWRYIIAKYCVMDVILCIELFNKLQILTNNIGMANVCYTPLSWIFMRGQGVKILSLVSRECKKQKYILPDLYIDRNDTDTYEGAVVLPPTPGIYLDDPVSVLDYASLYPSSMISENICHSTYINNEKYNGEEGGTLLNNLGYDFVDIKYPQYKIIYTLSGLVKEKQKTGEKINRFVQYRTNEKGNLPKGIIPNILRDLLGARKSTRVKIVYKTLLLKNGIKIIGKTSKKETHYEVLTQDKQTITVEFDDIEAVTDTYSTFEQDVLDGLQLAYKVTANSLYGQLGAKTSQVYLKDLAASTTATGRKQLEIAKNHIYANFPGAEVVYGDTDSIFVKFVNEKDGVKLKGKDAIRSSIEQGVMAEKGVQKELKAPQYLEYEKTFWPFILITKKRYTGIKYEFDINKGKITSMGLVTKRRDNALILKIIFGGIIDIIMYEHDINKSIDYLNICLDQLVNGVFGIEKLTITKTLNSYYKNPNQIAHKVLSDRMGNRDPGNKPQTNDRIPYVYIKTDIKKGESVLQGDKIENPQYVLDNKLEADYEHYITNQIMKPVSQIFALCIEDLPGSIYTRKYYKDLEINYKQKQIKDVYGKVWEQKQKDVQKYLFDNILRKLTNKKNKTSEITKWFTME